MNREASYKKIATKRS